MDQSKPTRRKWKRWAQKCGCFGEEPADLDNQNSNKQVINPPKVVTSVNSNGGSDVGGGTANAGDTNSPSNGDREISATEARSNAKNIRVEPNVNHGVGVAAEDALGISVNLVDMNNIPNRDGEVQATTDETDKLRSRSSSSPTPWEKAMNYIEESKEDKDIITNVKKFAELLDNDNPQGHPKDSAKDILQCLRKAVCGRDVEEGKNQWNVTVGDKQYSVRQCFRNAFTLLKNVAPIGDVLVSIDPVHAAAPWAAVRLTILVLDSRNKLKSDMVFGLAQIVTLIFQCDTYQQLYNRSNLSQEQYQDSISCLEEAMVQAYVKSLLFLGFAAQQFEGAHGFLAVFKLHDMQSYAQGLLDVGKELGEAAEACEKCRSHQNQSKGEEILRRLATVSDKTFETHRILGKIRQSDFISKLHRVKDAEFSSYGIINGPRCHEDTRVGLLQQIQDWIDDSEGEAVFWLQGLAGTGKSTISRTVSQMFQNTGELGATFFFKRGGGDRSQARYFFTTIAVQLCFKIPEFAEILAAREHEDHVSESFTEQFQELIMNPLESLKTEGGRGRSTILVVVDALDECDEKYDAVRKIVSLMSRTKTLRPMFDFRLFVTSRPECWIEYSSQLQDIDSFRDVALHEIPKSVVEKDISTYLSHELAKIRESYNNVTKKTLHLSEDWPGGDEIQQLVEMATPLFIFAATICRLLEQIAPDNPARELAEILNRPTSNANEKLVATYAPVLERLVFGKTADQRKRVQARFINIIGSIVLLAKPLPMEYIANLLEVSEDEVDGIVKSLRSVLVYPSKATAPLSLFHLSFREFLVTKHKNVPDGFWVDEIERNGILATKCLDLLSKDGNLRYDMCQVDLLGMRRHDISSDTVEKALPPDIQYACLYWVHHLKMSQVRLDDKHRVFAFLRDNFLHWLEAFSLMGRIPELILLIAQLQTVVDPSRGVGMLEFLRDAERFVAYFYHVIELAPLQIYSSALLFAPHQSVIRKTFEVRYLDWVIQHPVVEHDWNPCLQTLEKKDVSEVDWVALSGDGTRIASGEDGGIAVCKTKNRELQYMLKGHEDSVRSVVFSGDGTTIASGSGDKTIKIWNTRAGELCHTLEGHKGTVRCVAFSGDSSLVASGSEDKTVKVWNSRAGELCYTLEGHKDAVLCVAFSSDSNWVASGSADNTVKVWDTREKELCYTLKDHASVVSSVAFSSDSKLIASARGDRTINVWDTASGVLKRAINSGIPGHTFLVFLGDSNLIAGSDGGIITICNATKGTVCRTFRAHDGNINSISISANHQLMASASYDLTVKLWDMTKDTAEHPKGHTGPILSVDFSTNGKLMASASFDRTVKIWDATQGTLRHTIKEHTDWVTCVIFSPDSKLLASGLEDTTVKIWDTMQGTLRHTLKEHTSWVICLVFSADSKLLASGSEDTTVKIWDTMQGTLRHTLGEHKNSVTCLAFSADSKLLASGSYDQTVKIWDAARGTLCQTFEINDTPKSMLFCLANLHLVGKSDNSQVEIDIRSCTNKAQDGTSTEKTSVRTAMQPWTSYNSESQTKVEASVCYRLALDEEHSWIQRDGKDLLWIPPEYRPLVPETLGIHSLKARIGIGSKSGKVIVIGFKT